MRELHVVAVSEDGKSVVLAATKGAQRGGFRVALDGPLTAAVRGEFSRPPQDEPRVSTITVKEIQARLRAGESPEEISRSEGVDLDRVQRFSGPVLSEIARVVESTRAAVIVRTRRGPSVATLGESVDEHLRKAATAREDSARWSARRQEDGRWVVEVVWHARGGPRTGRWYWDPAARTVTAADPESAALGHLETEVAPAPARPGRDAAATKRAPRSATGVRTAAESPASAARAALAGKRPLPEAEAVAAPARRTSAKPDGAAAHGSAATRRAGLAARRVSGPAAPEDDGPAYEGGASAALRDPATVQRPAVTRTSPRPAARPAGRPAAAPAAPEQQPAGERAPAAPAPVRRRRAVQEAATAQAAADAAVARRRTATRRTPAAAPPAATPPTATPPTAPRPAEPSAAAAESPPPTGGSGPRAAAPGASPARRPASLPPAAVPPRRARTAALVARRAAAAAAAETVVGAVADDPSGSKAGDRPAGSAVQGDGPETAGRGSASAAPAEAAPAAERDSAAAPAPARRRAAQQGAEALDEAPTETSRVVRRARAAAPAGSRTSAPPRRSPAAQRPASPETGDRPPVEPETPAALEARLQAATRQPAPDPAAEPAPDSAAEPAPDPASEPTAAEQPLKVAAGAEPAGPVLRVVPPHAGAPRARPAREAARGRASVPAWADVLLGTSARAEAPDEDAPQQRPGQERAQPDEPPRG